MLNDKITLQDNFKFDYSTMLGDKRISEHDINALQDKICDAMKAVDEMRETGYVKAHLSKDGAKEPVYFARLPYIKNGNPNNGASIDKLLHLQKKIRAEVDLVVFLGVGGSYLGNKVLFDIFCGEGWNNFSCKERKSYPYVFFAGNNVDPQQCLQIYSQLSSIAEHVPSKTDKFTVLLVPISKSGTTLETLTAFSYFYDACMRNSKIKTDVAVVTDLAETAASPLYTLAKENNWLSFDIKEGIGGRFSVLHNPGLVTAAAIGLDIKALLAGAEAMDKACCGSEYLQNPALMNACLKYLASEKYGCDIEIVMGYGMCLKSLGEWYVQLLAESLGKRYNRQGQEVFYGRTPVAAVGSTDMHAQTQQHQDGKRNKVIQFIHIENLANDIVLNNPFAHVKDFSKYAGLSLKKALDVALASNREALDNDGRFSAVYSVPKLDEYYVGELLYFLMLSIAYEGELADVDAFDQPGVEGYKKIMKRDLSK